MRAGKLRHRVDIQVKQQSQNPENGEPVDEWVPAWKKCPAAVEPVSGREFIAGQATQSVVTGRVIIRYRPGVTTDMRVLYRGLIHNIQAVLPDSGSGKDNMTLLVSAGVNNG